MSELSQELHGSIKDAKWHEDYTDNTDSFKWDYEFKIPEVKQQMLDLLEKYTPEFVDKLLGKHLQNLKEERDRLTKTIDTLEGKIKPKELVVVAQ